MGENGIGHRIQSVVDSPKSVENIKQAIEN